MASPPGEEFAARLDRARNGSVEDLGEALEACRVYLSVLASRRLDPGLQGKGGASDLVQETFLEAQRDFRQFGGTSQAELVTWLSRLLLNNLANFARRYRGTGKRSVSREVALDEAQGDPRVAASGPSPSQQVAAGEQADRVQRAMAALPEEYRRVLRLRYEEGLPFDEVAARMGRSPNAVRKLWARAVERLGQEMGDGS